ncbi:hypothetical protein PPERSA_04478 [Pseudocohnilembus persalinus]|uniref:Uncharacterized protein n=1 Tax=Pseudocohnilembus persalinus TaxID=266149 RepID=A0A0V0QR90_PSEPJ|nr:hypothetical protein PPERSA_04478 [Pseudocohnilembus persalinus]|eukprot:KRX04663.1 hypothetical protein PPERSA_04478 [Pseudocohnilembus persalinus]
MQISPLQIKIKIKFKNQAIEIQGINNVIVPRSGYYSSLDRETALQTITAGVSNSRFGFGKIDMQMDKNRMKERKKANDDDLVIGNYKREEEENLKKDRANFTELSNFDGVALEKELNFIERTEKQRLEQRLLWNESGYQFFTENGDLIADDDFYERKITKVLLVSFEQNPANAIQRRNAILCERLNQNKHVGFKLNIYIGKVQLSKHPDQDAEEKMMQNLKKLMKRYRKRVDLALIPQCERIEQLIKQEHSELINKPDKPEKEIQILLNEQKRIIEIKNQEIQNLRNQMQDIVNQWKDIDNKRKDAQGQGKQNYMSTQYTLNIKKYYSDDQTNEVELGLGKIKDMEKFYDTTNLPQNEIKRREKINQDKYFVKLLINNKIVAETKTQNLKWPYFEVAFMEKFQILLYSKPSSIKLQVYKTKFIGSTLIDTVELEIPGEKMKTQTSSNRLLKNMEFSQGMAARYIKRLEDKEKQEKIEAELRKKKEVEERKRKIQEEKEKQKRATEEAKQRLNDPNAAAEENVMEEDDEEQRLKNEEVLRKEEEEREEQRKREEEIEKKRKQEEEIQREKDAKNNAQYEGRVSYMAEWEGNGPQMPPDSLDNFSRGKLIYDELYIDNEDAKDLQEQILNIESIDSEGFHFDVNDPRNEHYVEKLQSLYNTKERDLYMKNILMPFSDNFSLRQELIRLRQINPDVNNIPADEESCFMSYEYLEIFKQSKMGNDELQQIMHKEQDQQRNRMTMYNVAINHWELQSSKMETQLRINEILITLRQRQKELQKKKSQNQVAGGQITLKNIIDEFRFVEKDFRLMDWVKQICTQKRKLAPPKIKQDKFAISKVSQIKISLYIAYGRNIPVRLDDQQEDIKNREVLNNKMPNFQTAPNDIANQLSQYPGAPQNMGYQYNYQNYQNQFMQQPPGISKQYVKTTVYSYVDVKLLIPDQVKERQKKRLPIDEDCQSRGKYSSGSRPDWNSEADVIFKSQKLMKEQVESDKTAFGIYELINPANQLYVTLFEHKSKLSENPVNKNKVELQVDNYFLGNLSIPVCQVIKNPAQNATYKINRPLVLFGYCLDTSHSYQRSQASKLKFVKPDIPTTINLSINITPQIDLPEDQDLEYYGNKVDSELLFTAKNYLEGLRKTKQFGKRHIKLWAQDLKNNSYFLPQFVHPEGLEPPFDVNDASCIEKAARFVSLVPFKLENERFKDVPDSFMTCQQFLDIKGGDFEEHAALLCNYFIYIDKKLGGEHANFKSYIILGKAIPEGETYYVLRMKSDQTGEYQSVEIWNPQTGDPYVCKSRTYKSTFCYCIPTGSGKDNSLEDNDVACPLTQVGCIFDNENVYINMQKEIAPHQIDWNISNTKKWEPYLKPLIKKRIFPNGIPTIQTRLQYDQTDPQKVGRLTKSIESFIMKKIEEERRAYKQGVNQFTRFREDLQQQIKDYILKSLESIRFDCRLTGLSSDLGVNKEDQQKAISKLEEICKRLETACDKAERKIYGFPINFTFTDYDKIWQEIEATGISDVLRKDFEYICAVECFEYPCYIISVWVFVAIIFDEDDPIQNQFQNQLNPQY